MTYRKKLGQHGEALAEAHLLKQGYQILAKNWRCSIGELDLVALQEEMVIFVEVRTRRGQKSGPPEESITAAKQAKLIELAQTFLAQSKHINASWRIDIIAIVLDGRYQVVTFNHIKWAVEG